MIKTEKGETTIRGTLAEVRTDLTVIICAFRDTLSEEFTEERIDEIISDAVSMSKKKPDEVIDIVLKKLLEVLG